MNDNTGPIVTTEINQSFLDMFTDDKIRVKPLVGELIIIPLENGHNKTCPHCGKPAMFKAVVWRTEDRSVEECFCEEGGDCAAKSSNSANTKLLRGTTMFM
jgi:hypothetical protein